MRLTHTIPQVSDMDQELGLYRDSVGVVVLAENERPAGSLRH